MTTLTPSPVQENVPAEDSQPALVHAPPETDTPEAKRRHVFELLHQVSELLDQVPDASGAYQTPKWLLDDNRINELLTGTDVQAFMFAAVLKKLNR